MRLAELDGDRELPPHVAAVEIPTGVLDGAEYSLCDFVRVDRAAGLVVFARTGLTGSIALDEHNGEVVELLNEQRRRISPNATEFTAIAGALIAWFEQSDVMSPSERVERFRPVIEARFPASFSDADGYWAALLDDITIGDYDSI